MGLNVEGIQEHRIDQKYRDDENAKMGEWSDNEW